jgi:hypothetical protein
MKVVCRRNVTVRAFGLSMLPDEVWRQAQQDITR